MDGEPTREVRELATSGPIFSALGEGAWQRWPRAASAFERVLPEELERGRRVHQLCVPLLLWLARVLDMRPDRSRPAVVGLSGPQGSGKSTLAQQLLPVLGELGLRAAAVSIDDFYLRREDQLRLAAAHPGNPYLEHRGAPGTHDLALGTATLDRLRALRAGETLLVPAYDKSAHGGRGDRLPEAFWPAVAGPLDLVILEGWMLGFQAVDEERIADPRLRVVNRFLTGYADWHQRLDALIALRTADPETIVRWRVEAEAARAAAGQPALDPAAALDYVRRFLPLYTLYADTVTRGRWDADHRLEVWLGSDRLPARPPEP